MTQRLDGIDVSRYQGTVDWVQVKASCAVPSKSLAAWKVTQGTRTLDPAAGTNRKNTATAGIYYRFGYHWLSASTNALSQAKWFLQNFAPLQPGEGVILDCEEAGITVPQITTWCAHVEAVTGRPVAIYTGVHVAGGAIWNSQLIFGSGQRMRWLAAYVSEAKARKACEPYGFDVWQWSSSGSVPGVAGRCDVNMIDHPTLCDLATGQTPPKPPVPPTEIEDLDMPVCTNAEVFGGFAPLIVKWVVMSNGSLRHIGEPEWHARGSEVGTRLSNADIKALGGSL
ncbi:Acm Lyzozyme M1 (1,4-beta-N-acetylmuramidase) [uncultured Caudovirales phage]|uniref:lysozyme n=1 Tax=uncultured Caudovirales phage TaxID=2100421 RepID=A0A6J7XEF1_9CAUD|nr:Acm Lyzozyme M1 (1,4-beta-N-acetylmuramidase) [uncultured Caudovirales phage]CAB4210250.1 Acm Lyzozyme M1 (1,4-beta-N-acetylmuramidase) [uncultured Caudovirales phage]CAB5227421.1 Acm Lyzozyme M1 (1,4-beta-N-acetylmuramidase) [uncultured Caudovirales phage]